MATVATNSGKQVPLLISTHEDVDHYVQAIKECTGGTLRELLGAPGTDPLSVIGRIKFTDLGRHPIYGHPLNFIEQVNQTWTFLVALEAARMLLSLHPEAGGFKLAPGAHMAQPLDIMSFADGLVGAETFAAVLPTNNDKLRTDLKKLAGRTEAHRYVFFHSPTFRGTHRRTVLERDDVQVWSVDLAW